MRATTMRTFFAMYRTGHAIGHIIIIIIVILVITVRSEPLIPSPVPAVMPPPPGQQCLDDNIFWLTLLPAPSVLSEVRKTQLINLLPLLLDQFCFLSLHQIDDTIWAQGWNQNRSHQGHYLSLIL